MTELTTDQIRNIIKETAYQVDQSTKSETSGLVMELKSEIVHIKDTMKDGFDGVHKRQDVTNGKVIKNTEINYYGNNYNFYSFVTLTVF